MCENLFFSTKELKNKLYKETNMAKHKLSHAEEVKGGKDSHAHHKKMHSHHMKEAKKHEGHMKKHMFHHKKGEM